MAPVDATLRSGRFAPFPLSDRFVLMGSPVHGCETVVSPPASAVFDSNETAVECAGSHSVSDSKNDAE